MGTIPLFSNYLLQVELFKQYHVGSFSYKIGIGKPQPKFFGIQKYLCYANLLVF
jgi:hypothetical protein